MQSRDITLCEDVVEVTASQHNENGWDVAFLSIIINWGPSISLFHIYPASLDLCMH